MTTDEIIKHFSPTYSHRIPEAKLLEFTGFKLLKEFCFPERNGPDNYLYLGLVDGRPFYYEEQQGVWMDDFGFIDEMKVPE